MRSRGADRPDDDADLHDEQAGRGRRLFGRGRPEPVEPEEVPREETGWLDDLRTAKEERAAIGPGKASDGRSSKSGKVAPGPDDAIDDGPGFPGAGPDARADSAAPPAPRSSAAPISRRAPFVAARRSSAASRSSVPRSSAVPRSSPAPLVGRV